ncbi:DUF1934 domain-containing protein [Pontibacillus yanchengensis]|uniref:DUF1934 domain-containing protein n=1 Tax=Pontibacillus yanchengensis Y32 TaxID=1385514 RepID=A0A0A2TF30_9BACI|nr:DUF1934 domain-containing protein [Pontibacillus yanchengensis]KGP74174.1 hypothetical protein N782_08955 [Pontibacillus yanchengensis Y32]
MSDERTPIQVKLVTEIKNQDQTDEIVVEESGDFIHKGNAYILRFTEHHDEEQPIDNLVTIHPDKVIVRRTGPVRMNQVFRENAITENVYYHPYGKFHMQTTTKSISLEESSDQIKGKLMISYDLEMNGQDKQGHRLSLRYNEEGQS